MNRLRNLLPAPVRSWLNRSRQAARRSLLIFDRVQDWSALRRLTPYRTDFGAMRGTCIDRVYIEQFLDTYRDSIRGRVAEIGSDHYTRLFGSRLVTHSDVLDIAVQNDRRTITIDLAQTAEAPENRFDCIICTQTLFEIFDYASAIRTLHKMLAPSGVLLATLPGISQSVRGRMLGGAGSDWWRFTGASAARAFAEVFTRDNVTVHTYGNVLAATAFLHGIVKEELTPAELQYHDPDYEVTIAVRSIKR